MGSVASIPELFAHSVELYGSRALVSVDDHALSFAEFAARVQLAAAALRAAGVQAGDRVVLLMPNSVDGLALLVGAMQLGALPAPINVRFGVLELSHIFQELEPRVIVVTELAGFKRGLVQLVAKVLGDADVPSGEAGVFRPHDSSSSLEQFWARAHASPKLDAANEPTAAGRDALILYTSGTTAAPRGCVLSHASLLSNARQMAKQMFDLTGADKLWNPLPFCHIGSLMPWLACATSGAAFASTAFFEPVSALRVLVDGCTIAHPSFETIWNRVLQSASPELSELRRLRLIHLVGAGVPLAQTRAPWAEFVGGYGATEVSGVVCSHRSTDHVNSRGTTSGTTFTGVSIAIVDPESGAPVTQGHSGEIVVRGHCVFERYYDESPCESSQREWRSGDLGYWDSAGHLVFLGRSKDVLKVGGENVSPLEVERCLAEHPAIIFSQVVAAPHPTQGETVAAFVQTVPGSPLTAEDVVKFCRSRIAAFKIPRHVRFVDEWPMSATKVQKSELRRRIAAELAACGPEERAP